MCWCTPTIRTPHCGKSSCVPPLPWEGRIVTLAPPDSGARIDELQAKASLSEGERIELTMLLNRKWAAREVTA